MASKPILSFTYDFLPEQKIVRSAVPTPFSKKINKSYRIPKIPKKIDVPKEAIGENHGDNSQDAIMDGSSDDDLTRKASDQAKGPFMSFYPNFTSILAYKVGF